MRGYEAKGSRIMLVLSCACLLLASCWTHSCAYAIGYSIPMCAQRRSKRYNAEPGPQLRQEGKGPAIEGGTIPPRDIIEAAPLRVKEFAVKFG